MASVAVVDSGGANITSVLFALERLGAPAKLTADPAEIAAVHAFLASEDAAYITGQVIFVDGGMSVGV